MDVEGSGRGLKFDGQSDVPEVPEGTMKSFLRSSVHLPRF